MKKNDMQENTISFFPILGLQVLLCHICYMIVQWLNPQMVKVYCYLVDIIMMTRPGETKFWNFVLGPILGPFLISLCKDKEAST